MFARGNAEMLVRFSAFLVGSAWVVMVRVAVAAPVVAAKLCSECGAAGASVVGSGGDDDDWARGEALVSRTEAKTAVDMPFCTQRCRSRARHSSALRFIRRTTSLVDVGAAAAAVAAAVDDRDSGEAGGVKVGVGVATTPPTPSVCRSSSAAVEEKGDIVAGHTPAGEGSAAASRDTPVCSSRLSTDGEEGGTIA